MIFFRVLPSSIRLLNILIGKSTIYLLFFFLLIISLYIFFLNLVHEFAVVLLLQLTH